MTGPGPRRYRPTRAEWAAWAVIFLAAAYFLGHLVAAVIRHTV